MKEAELTISAPISPPFAAILTSDALAFVAKLETIFGERRRQLLQRRQERQAKIDAGQMPMFLLETADIRQSPWQVASIPHDLCDRPSRAQNDHQRP
jgi:malate synthase